MPRLRKAIFNKQVHMLTTSVEEGIMLPCNAVIKHMVLAALIRAQDHHPIDVCHYVVNGTHMHLITLVENPEDIPKFMERFKTELSHYINRHLGRKKRTIWCKSYDSPALLTVGDVVRKIAYIYNNPVKDGLIDSIDRYPGLSSWEGYKTGNHSIKSNLLRRDEIFPVPQDGGANVFRRAREMLKRVCSRKGKFIIKPDAWMQAFYMEQTPDEVNESIKQIIKEQELEIQKEKKSFMGRVKLENQGVELNYQPQREGKKMWCICSDIDLRKKYLIFLKSLCEEAKEIYKNICSGDLSVQYPPGLFPPRLPLLAGLVFRGL